MSTTSDATSGSWWESITVFEDNYVPDSYSASVSVETNHALAAGIRENDFDVQDQAYTYGLLTLAIVFLVAGLVACICLPCCYQCLGKSRQERLQARLSNERVGEGKRGFLMLLFSVMALASAAGAMSGLYQTDTALESIEDNTQDLADQLRSVIDLYERTRSSLEDVAVSYDALLVGVDECDPTGLLSVALTGVDVDGLIESLLTELEDLAGDDVEELSAAVETVSESVATTEGLRKGVVWPAIVLSLLVVVTFIVVGISAYGFIACGARPCGPLTCIVLPGTVFLAIVVWLSAASAVTLSALSGDFCIEADQNAYDLIINSNSNEMQQQLLLYYTGDCTTDNTIVDTIIASQTTAMEIIEMAMPVLDAIERACDDLSSTVESIDSNLETVWGILNDAAVTTSCGNINSLYQEAVYDDSCHELPEGLLGFWVSCVFLTVLLLILVTLWSLMLRRRRTDKDFAEVQASARRRVGWMSTRSFRSTRNDRNPTTNQLSASSSAAAAHTNPTASGRYAVADPTTSGRFTSGHYPVHTGRAAAAVATPSGRDARRPPPQVPTVTQQDEHSGFSGHNPPAQRPVVLDKPQRPHR